MTERVNIWVASHLDDARSTWFDGLVIERLAGGKTLLSGEVADQAALHGLLARVRDLGLPLVAVVVTPVLNEAATRG
jgi:hypothetical protein